MTTSDRSDRQLRDRQLRETREHYDATFARKISICISRHCCERGHCVSLQNVIVRKEFSYLGLVNTVRSACILCEGESVCGGVLQNFYSFFSLYIVEACEKNV